MNCSPHQMCSHLTSLYNVTLRFIVHIRPNHQCDSGYSFSISFVPNMGIFFFGVRGLFLYGGSHHCSNTNQVIRPNLRTWWLNSVTRNFPPNKFPAFRHGDHSFHAFAFNSCSVLYNPCQSTHINKHRSADAHLAGESFLQEGQAKKKGGGNNPADSPCVLLVRTKGWTYIGKVM